MSGLRFDSPSWLIVGAVAVVVAMLWRRHRRRTREVVVFGDTRVLAQLPATLAERLAPLVQLLLLVSLLGLVTVLARPQFGRTHQHRRTEGIAIQVCLDTSGSMRAMDFQIDEERVDRMEVVKRTFVEFVRGDDSALTGRRDDLVGLIAFGGWADSKVPLTLDHDVLVEVAETLEVPEEIRQGAHIVNQEELSTAIGDALALAVERIKDAPATSRVVILLTDGMNTAGIIDPRQAAELASSLGIRVYTVGIGSNEMAPYPVKDAFGKTFLQAKQFRIDEDLLREIAAETGGIYRNARDTSALKGVYAEIDKLERTKLEGHIEIEYEERFQPLLVMVLLGLLGFELLTATRFRELP